MFLSRDSSRDTCLYVRFFKARLSLGDPPDHAEQGFHKLPVPQQVAIFGVYRVVIHNLLLPRSFVRVKWTGIAHRHAEGIKKGAQG